MFDYPSALATEAQFRRRIVLALARFPDLRARPAEFRHEGHHLIARVSVAGSAEVYEWAFPLPPTPTWPAAPSLN